MRNWILFLIVANALVAFGQDKKPSAAPALPLIAAVKADPPVDKTKPDVIVAEDVDQLRIVIQSLLIERDSLREQLAQLQQQLYKMSGNNNQLNTDALVGQLYMKYGLSQADYELKKDPNDNLWKYYKKPAPAPASPVPPKP